MFNSSTAMAKGNFHRPEGVLDNVAKSAPTDDGVIDINTRDVNGRILISKNTIIMGAVVDGTGETAVAALCKLLLLPYGSYSFRKANPVDQVELQQDLNLHMSDAKQFLQGPSSIGLAAPAEQTLNNLKAQNEFGWETTSFRANYQDSPEEGSPKPYGQDPQSEEYIHECNRLLEIKREVEAYVLKSQPRKTGEIELIEGALPSRKGKGEGIHPAWVIGAVVVFLGLLGYSMMTKEQADTIQETVAPILQGAPNSTTSDPTVANAPPPEQAPPKQEQPGTAPFAFPSGPASRAAPPPNWGGGTRADEEAAEAEAEEQVKQDDAGTTPPPPPPPPRASNTPAPPMVTSAGNQEVSKWQLSVRRDPADPKARKELAYAYLMAGDPNSSIEQFYAAMKLQRQDSDSIISYADNLMAFGGRERAKLFLTEILRVDPSQKAVRDKLTALR